MLNTNIQIISKLQCSILLQLRTEHIKLNLCMHQLQHIDYYQLQIHKLNQMTHYLQCDQICCIKYNSGMCNFCISKLESVLHYLMDCKKYTAERLLLYDEIMKMFNMYQLDFVLKNLLFSPVNVNNQHRKHIYQLICNYVLITKRIYFKIY